MAMVDVERSIHLSTDAQPKSDGVDWGLAATRRSLTLHSSNEPGELSQWPCHDNSTTNIVAELSLLLLLSSLYGTRQTIIFSSRRLFSFFFFSSPNLSRSRLDVCHTSTHGVAL